MSESLKTAFRTLLTGDSAGGVTALAGDAIRPDKLAEDDDLPGIIIGIESDEGMVDLSGLEPREGMATVALACCAHTSAGATALERAVRDVLNGPPGDVGGLTITALQYQSTGYEHEPATDDSDDDDWFINVARFFVFYRRGA